MRSSDPFEYWHLDGSAIMFDPLARIQRSAFPPIIFL